MQHIATQHLPVPPTFFLSSPQGLCMTRQVIWWFNRHSTTGAGSEFLVLPHPGLVPRNVQIYPRPTKRSLEYKVHLWSCPNFGVKHFNFIQRPIVSGCQTLGSNHFIFGASFCICSIRFSLRWPCASVARSRRAARGGWEAPGDGHPFDFVSPSVFSHNMLLFNTFHVFFPTKLEVQLF